MSTYKITILYAQLDLSINPPPILFSVFPEADYIDCTLSSEGIFVTFDSPQTPVDLGPLVKVELLPSE